MKYLPHIVRGFLAWFEPTILTWSAWLVVSAIVTAFVVNNTPYSMWASFLRSIIWTIPVFLLIYSCVLATYLGDEHRGWRVDVTNFLIAVAQEQERDKEKLREEARKILEPDSKAEREALEELDRYLKRLPIPKK